MAQAGGLPGLGDILSQELENILVAQTEQENLGQVFERIGNAQVGILQKNADRTNAQLQNILATAEKGFQKAATDFQDAVAEFAAMRGGTIAEQDVRRAEIRLQRQQQNVTGAAGGVTAAEEALAKAKESKKPEDIALAEENLKAAKENLAMQKAILENRQRQLAVAQEALKREKEIKDKTGK